MSDAICPRCDHELTSDGRTLSCPHCRLQINIKLADDLTLDTIRRLLRGERVVQHRPLGDFELSIHDLTDPVSPAFQRVAL